MSATDTGQYPNSTASRNLLPTITGAKTTKFKASAAYEEMEVIKDETGIPFLYNGINNQFLYDIEIMPTSGFSAAPAELTTLTFVKNAASNAAAYPGATTGGNINILIIGEVARTTDDAGKVVKYGFKGVTNGGVPNPNT